MTINNDLKSGSKGCGRFFTIVGLIASVITIFIFITGWVDIPHILQVLNIGQYFYLVTPTSEPSNHVVLSQPIKQPSSTDSLAYLNDYVIPGNSNQGIVISIPKSGNYRLEYLSGAYKTNPSDENSWLTAIYVFHGTSPVWDGRLLSKADANIFADHGLLGSQSEATSLASGNYTQDYYDVGDFLTLVGADFSDSYSDNSGEVYISLYEVK